MRLPTYLSLNPVFNETFTDVTLTSWKENKITPPTLRFECKQKCSCIWQVYISLIFSFKLTISRQVVKMFFMMSAFFLVRFSSFCYCSIFFQKWLHKGCIRWRIIFNFQQCFSECLITGWCPYGEALMQ